MITIILPTMNRPDFLSRSLKYYTEAGDTNSIYIGDASDQEYAQETKRVVEEFKNHLRISYFECRTLSVPQTVHLLNQQVKTPYATYVSDDDFLVPRGLKECVSFLDQNPEYVAANGKAAILTLRTGGVYGDLKDLGMYPMLALTGHSGSERLSQFFKNYFVNLFSVHRTKVWKEMWADVEVIKDIPFAGELLPCSLSAVKGKTKHLNCFYLVRQHHNKRDKPYLMASNSQWITSENWQPSYQIFKDSLSRALQQQDNISEQEASFITHEAFWFYMTKYFYHQYLRKYSSVEATKQKIKMILKGVPGIKTLIMPSFKSARAKVFPARTMNLPSILNSRSPYHKDFMAVYESFIK